MQIRILPEDLVDGGEHLVVQLQCRFGVEVGHTSEGAVHDGHKVFHGPALL